LRRGGRCPRNFVPRSEARGKGPAGRPAGPGTTVFHRLPPTSPTAWGTKPTPKSARKKTERQQSGDRRLFGARPRPTRKRGKRRDQTGEAGPEVARPRTQSAGGWPQSRDVRARSRGGVGQYPHIVRTATRPPFGRRGPRLARECSTVGRAGRLSDHT